MKKVKKLSAILFLLVIAFVSVNFSNLYGDGLDELAANSSSAILNFFKNNEIYQVNSTIFKFENFSGHPDLTAQQYYQLLVAKLDRAARNLNGVQFKFNDLMINFSKNQGYFNHNRAEKCNFLFYVKLTGNKGKLGAGIVIFSRSLDRVVFLRYFETLLSEEENEIIATKDYGFDETGFSKVIEIEAKEKLLDFQSIRSVKSRGDYRYYFYYPDKIEIFENTAAGFKKSFSFNLEWGRPYYPVRQPEGKLSYFYRDGALILTAGNNFSHQSKIFEFKDSRWSELEGVNFVPFKLVKINVGTYLAGARYKLGLNYFRSSMVFVPLRSDGLKISETVEKSVPPFYSLAFAVDKEDDNLSSVHLLDKNYNYRYFSADLVEQTVENDKRGAAVCALDDQWLAISDYSRLTDRLYFYKIQYGMRNLIYQGKVKGEVVFISAGYWKETKGFWVYVRIPGNGNGKRNDVPSPGDDYRLQFWSKNEY